MFESWTLRNTGIDVTAAWEQHKTARRRFDSVIPVENLLFLCQDSTSSRIPDRGEISSFEQMLGIGPESSNWQDTAL